MTTFLDQVALLVDAQAVHAEFYQLWAVSQALCAEAGQLWAASLALCAETQQLWAVSQALCTEARQQHSPWPGDGNVAAPFEEPLPLAAVLPASDPQDQMLHVARAIRELLDTLPLEWQVSVVKMLTARTILKAQEQGHPQRVHTA